jgi:hypothetical protein
VYGFAVCVYGNSFSDIKAKRTRAAYNLLQKTCRIQNPSL